MVLTHFVDGGFGVDEFILPIREQTKDFRGLVSPPRFCRHFNVFVVVVSFVVVGGSHLSDGVKSINRERAVRVLNL